MLIATATVTNVDLQQQATTPSATATNVDIGEVQSRQLGVVQEVLFLPAETGYEFGGVRHNRIHPIDDAAHLAVYQQEPFFAVLLVTILALGIAAIAWEFVYVLHSRDRVQGLQRALFIHTGHVHEEPALMVARNVPWIDFSKPDSSHITKQVRVGEFVGEWAGG